MPIVSPPLTFPRDLLAPETIAECRMDLDRLMTTGATRGGSPVAADVGRPQWRWRYRTRPLHERDALAWEAWLDSLRGGQRWFKAWHPLRRYLVEYRGGYATLQRAAAAGGGAWPGTATILATGAQLDTITLGGLPAGLVFRAGDLVSMSYTATSQGLHRVQVDATASGSGVVVIAVDPVMVPGLVGQTVTLLQPYCHAAIDYKSLEVQWQRGRIAQVAFQALQVF